MTERAEMSTPERDRPRVVETVRPGHQKKHQMDAHLRDREAARTGRGRRHPEGDARQRRGERETTNVQGISSVDPLVRRASRSACARATSSNG